MELRSWMERWAMLPPAGGTLLVAVSGGRDSVCLLHYLASLPRDFTVAAAHLDHGQRPTAGRDVAFVRDLCQKLGVPCYVERADVPALAQAAGVGLEEAGRRARYDFFLRTAEAIGAQRIATAHHADDQAETVLLNLLRGTGPQGLAGIPPVRGPIVRPLLQTTRREIEDYLHEHGLSWVEDETNADETLRRNLLRHRLMPQLEQVHPGAAGSICRAAELLRQEDVFLDELAAAYLPPEGAVAERSRLLEAPPVLRLRALRLLTERLPVGKKDFTATHYRAMSDLLEGGGLLELPGRARAVCRGDELRLERTPSEPEALSLHMGENIWGEYRLILSEASAPEGACLHLRLCTGALSVRPYRASDRLALPDSRGSRSVKRLLTERGFPPEQRGRIPVLCVDDTPAAVWGVGVDKAFLPEESGQSICITVSTRRGEHNG